MVEILIALLIIPLAGYAIGRTIGEESAFEEFRARVENGPFLKTVDVNGDSHFLYPEEGGTSRRTGHSWFYGPSILDQIYNIDVEGFIYDEELEEAIEVTDQRVATRAPNGYKPGFFGFIRGKVGDLLTCSTCLTGQSCLWLGVAWIIFGASMFQYIVPLSAIGIGYVIMTLLDRISR